MNADQRASSTAPWQPDVLAGFRVGDHVRLPGIQAVLRIVRLDDPLLILEGPNGRELKAGWRAVQRVPRGDTRGRRR